MSSTGAATSEPAGRRSPRRSSSTSAPAATLRVGRPRAPPARRFSREISLRGSRRAAASNSLRRLALAVLRAQRHAEVVEQHRVLRARRASAARRCRSASRACPSSSAMSPRIAWLERVLGIERERAARPRPARFARSRRAMRHRARICHVAARSGSSSTGLARRRLGLGLAARRRAARSPAAGAATRRPGASPIARLRRRDRLVPARRAAQRRAPARTSGTGSLRSSATARRRTSTASSYRPRSQSTRPCCRAPRRHQPELTYREQRQRRWSTSLAARPT